jgi:Tfp pilus assembly major pilin PilA
MDFSAYHITLIIVASITGVLSPILVELFQYILKRKDVSKKESLSNYKTFENEDRIIKKLESIREKFDCDRVWIAEFHNGNKTYSGRSFQKFSQTYEVVRRGIAAESNSTQNIPTSIFSKFFQTLSEKGHYVANDIGEAQDVVAFSMLSFWSNRGIISCAVIAIKDINNNFVGILCLDGVIGKLNLNNEQIIELTIAASNISGYLNNKR